MAIKWSVVRVSEAMDEIESQVALAQGFFTEAKALAEKAQAIPNLPEYMQQRLRRLLGDIERIDNVKRSIKAIRNDIPQEAMDEERRLASYGSQQSLV